MNGYQRPAAKLARRLGWNHIHGDGLRPRLWDLASDGRPWWDWGHRLMTVVGSDFGGNWDEPKPPTWWYRHPDLAVPHRVPPPPAVNVRGHH
jgi:hypothetical protein